MNEYEIIKIGIMMRFPEIQKYDVTHIGMSEEYCKNNLIKKIKFISEEYAGNEHANKIIELAQEILELKMVHMNVGTIARQLCDVIDFKFPSKIGKEMLEESKTLKRYHDIIEKIDREIINM